MLKLSVIFVLVVAICGRRIDTKQANNDEESKTWEPTEPTWEPTWETTWDPTWDPTENSDSTWDPTWDPTENSDSTWDPTQSSISTWDPPETTNPTWPPTWGPSTLPPDDDDNHDPRCVNNEISYWPHPKYCRYYIECFEGDSYTMQCPPGLFFSDYYKECVEAYRSECCNGHKDC